ncbi:MAG TPA: ATP-binding protein [Cytophagales bacterium]|nr:ATP-binding protein [Cytophagales bacterium]
MRKQTFFNWSTGKDSALALWHLQQQEEYQVKHLLTTINAHHDRVTMHGLRRSLYDAQMQALGIPYSTVELPEMPDMTTYEEQMNRALQPLLAEGYTHAAYGDIFLEDLKKYRDDELAKAGLTGVYPIWKRDTRELAKEFIERGFRAVIVTCKAELMGEDFVGREFDASLLNDLPAEVDPCGENGEFHTFCYAGPIFQRPISFSHGEKVLRTYPAPKTEDGEPMSEVGFWYQDLTN